VRILVDQSGYDLLNIGDVAMLQSCVTRLRRQWPQSEIMVIAHDPALLAAYCPGSRAISRVFADRPPARLLPSKLRLAAEQGWKIAGPYAARRPGAPAGRPRTAVQAVRAADLVVASGGGYLTDTFWWHAAGVLSLLSLAQRLGKPTAMFGQGIGPLRGRALRRQARAVLPRLTVLGLREDRAGPGLARSLGVPPSAVLVTGDDALEQAGGTAPAQCGTALGFSLRVSGYAGLDAAAAASVCEVVLAAGRALGAPVTALPVSRYAADGDLRVLRAAAGRGPAGAGIEVTDLDTPGALWAAVANCRAVVAGSYHAAVFSLALGIPAVCLTRSAYYDAKFSGLVSLFPGACQMIGLGGPGWAAGLREAIGRAWRLPPADRGAARAVAARLQGAGRDAYARLGEAFGAPVAAGQHRGPGW
jgi:polysaccharide pyruvyl transferase WcaK-like protein